MIRLKNIKKSFGDKVVLKDISILFPTNKITVISGPSGEGKSTIFRIITALEKQDSGELIKDENDSIGLVFQSNALYPHYTVLNNLVIPQRVVLKYSKSVAKERALEVLDSLNIKDLQDKPISTLSGGEAQRVAIGRSLVMDNNIILFDEPTSALDQTNTKKLISLLQDLKKDKTIIIITHDTLFSKDVGDLMYELKDGELIEINN